MAVLLDGLLPFPGDDLFDVCGRLGFSVDDSAFSSRLLATVILRTV